MTYIETKIYELEEAIKVHRGVGESDRFYQLKAEIVQKLGYIKWEKLLHAAKIRVAKGENK